MFLKSRAGRANLDTKFPKPFAWPSVMISALQVGSKEIDCCHCYTWYIQKLEQNLNMLAAHMENFKMKRVVRH